ncbi:MAG: molecular chaperone DnaJ, partial [Flavobacteriales bacterium CG_4_10_14_0_8_um_filter_32_5]
MKNYYQILNLSTDCNKDEIKKAYRMYATKFHPDKQNNDKFFEERF